MVCFHFVCHCCHPHNQNLVSVSCSSWGSWMDRSYCRIPWLPLFKKSGPCLSCVSWRLGPFPFLFWVVTSQGIPALLLWQWVKVAVNINIVAAIVWYLLTQVVVPGSQTGESGCTSQTWFFPFYTPSLWKSTLWKSQCPVYQRSDLFDCLFSSSYSLKSSLPAWKQMLKPMWAKRHSGWELFVGLLTSLGEKLEI